MPILSTYNIAIVWLVVWNVLCLFFIFILLTLYFLLFLKSVRCLAANMSVYCIMHSTFSFILSTRLCSQWLDWTLMPENIHKFWLLVGGDISNMSRCRYCIGFWAHITSCLIVIRSASVNPGSLFCVTALSSVSQKRDTYPFITLTNAGRFLKFFHCHTLYA